MKLRNAFMCLNPLWLASLRTAADLDLSDNGTQHELALRASDARLGFQPTDEGIEALGADAIDDHGVVSRAGDVQGQLDLVALRDPPFELGRVCAGRQADIDHGAHVPAERGRVDVGAVTTDYAGRLQAADSIGDRA